MAHETAYDEEKSDAALFAGRLEWTGTMVDIYPVGDHSVSDMLDCDLAGPFDDIKDANDTSRFDDGEQLGFVYFEDETEYDLVVK